MDEHRGDWPLLTAIAGLYAAVNSEAYLLYAFVGLRSYILSEECHLISGRIPTGMLR